MKTLKLTAMMALTVFQMAFAIDMPCAPHGGSALPWEGSGTCTGNNQIEIPLSTAGISLIYNSIGGDESFGIGSAAWRLSLDHRLIDESNTVQPRVILDRGDGTKIPFYKSGSIWTADPTLSKSTLEKVGVWKEKAIDGSELTYTSLGLNVYGVTSIKNIKNHVNTLKRTNGLITKIISPFGNTVTLLYSNGHLDEITDLLDQKIKFINLTLNTTSGAKPFLSQILFANNTFWSISHLAEGGTLASRNVLKIASPEGDTQKFNYISEGILSKIESGVSSVSFQYASDSVTAFATDGKVTEWFLNGKITRESENNAITDYIYNADGLPSLITNSLGQATVLGYDGDKNLNYLRLPDGSVESTSYYDNSSGFKFKPMTKIITQNGNEVKHTDYKFHTNGAYKSIISQDGSAAYYDDKENLTHVYEKNMLVTTNTYNENSSLISEKDELTGFSTTYTYHPDGTLASETDYLGRYQNFTRNKLGLVTHQVSSSGVTEDNEYSVVGEKILAKLTGPTGLTLTKTMSRKITYSDSSVIEASLNPKRKAIEASFNLAPLLALFPMTYSYGAGSVEIADVLSVSRTNGTIGPLGPVAGTTSTAYPSTGGTATGTTGPLGSSGPSSTLTCSVVKCEKWCKYEENFETHPDSPTTNNSDPDWFGVNGGSVACTNMDEPADSKGNCLDGTFPLEGHPDIFKCLLVKSTAMNPNPERRCPE